MIPENSFQDILRKIDFWYDFPVHVNDEVKSFAAELLELLIKDYEARSRFF